MTSSTHPGPEGWRHPRGRQAELARIRFVTAHYEMLQGLPVIPLALTLAFVTFAGSPAGERFDHPGWQVAVTALGAAATALALWHARRFRERHGAVRPRPGQGRGLALGTFAAAAPVFALQAIDAESPVSLEGLAVSAVALAAGWLLRPLAAPFLLVGGLGAVASLLPLGSWAGAEGHPLSQMPYLVIAVNAGTVVVAAWGHLLLRRTLAAPAAAG